MTKKTGKSRRSGQTKRLSLSKQTLKDLSAPANGPKGGMGIKVVQTMLKTCPAACRKR